jgi:hypothetical protein
MIDIQATQAYVLALTQEPAQAMNVTQAYVNALVNEEQEIRVTQAYIMALVRGRTEDPQVRAWTFTLDGHDYYVLRLGAAETLVYDTHSEQWYVWGSDDSDLWKAYTGSNWSDGHTLAATQGASTSIIVGDDGNGALYFLDTDAYVDDDSLYGSDVPRQYLREATGQVAVRAVDQVPCFGVRVEGSIGEMDNALLTAVTLSTSDDRGHTFDDHGTLTIANADYDFRAEWRSLGSFGSPGRLFRVQDYGALHRIDYFDMLEVEDDG